MKGFALGQISVFCLSLSSLALAGAKTGDAKGPNDAEIAAIVVTANSVDINAGKVAEGKTTNKEVKQFAQQMITDHTAVNKSAVELATKLKLTPEENDTSRSLKKGGEENLRKLAGLTAKDFDKAYVKHEVEYHETVLNAIDKVLIPSAKNAELKALIEKVRPAFAAHLEHARKIQTSLK